MSYQSILKEPGAYLPMAFRRYIDPMTEIPVVGDTAKKIADKVIFERKERNLPTEDVLKEVEEYLCSQLPSLCQRRITGMMVKKEYTKADVLAFIESVKGTLTSGGVVSEEEAARRANVCLTCPYNLRLAGCEGCNGISSLVFKLLGARRITNMGALKACGICGCSLKAKIWVPKETLQKTSQIQATQGQFPSWCWVEK